MTPLGWLGRKTSTQTNCPVNVWLGKLTALDMTPLGWLGRKTSTQTNKQIEPKLGATWRLRIAKIILFQCPRWLPVSAILKIFKQYLTAILKVFSCYLLPNSKSDWVEMVEGIGASWRFRIAKMVPFWYPRWSPWQPSWKSSNHNYLLPNGKSDCALIWYNISLGCYGNSELLKSICSNVQDGRQLEILQTTSPLKQ